MEQLTTREIAQAVSGTANCEKIIDSISTDSRQILPGCLFIALEGERFDGHAYAQNACEQGAACVLSHKPLPETIPHILVEDTRKALLRLAAYYRKKFTLQVVGLTGSVGKTTTKEMIAQVLGCRGKTLKTKGNFNNEIGLPKMVFELDKSYEAAVFEMGMSGFGEIRNLTRVCRPDIGLITNIGVSHIEKLGSKEGILKAKLELLEGMDKSAPLILNGDDAMLVQAASLIENPVTLFGIRNENCRYRGADIVTREEGMTFRVLFDGTSQEINLPVVGQHNVLNALAAFAVGRALHIASEDISEALSRYIPAGMRQNIVRRHDMVMIEDCYNASPDSVKASLGVLCAMKAKRKIAVLGDMLELGDYAPQAHTRCGEYAAQMRVDCLYAYGNLAKDYLKGAEKEGLAQTFYFESKAQLANALYEELRPGDAVLVKGSRGMKLEEVLKELYERWDLQ